MLNDLRALGSVRAPDGFVERVLEELRLGDAYAIAESAIGPVFVAWNARGVRSVVRARDAAAFERGHCERFGVTPHLADATPDWIKAALIDGASRKARRFDFASLSPFERDVLMKTREIPRGQVRPYAWVAREIGRPKAVRAVGSALAKNPVPLVIPCHRVVRSDGIIGNYALGGVTNKTRLLKAEGVDLDALPQLTRTWAI